MGDVFVDQITTRRNFDENMYKEALNDLLSILNIKGPHTIVEVKGAISEILNYLNKDIPNLADNKHDIDLQLEYMLRPSGTMKRRVELLGQWWKDSTGCLLAGTKSDEVIALLQDDWGNYFYHNSKGEKIKINKITASNINVDAFCFYKSFPLGSLKIKDLFIFMIKSLSRSDIILIILTYFITQFLGMISPYITKTIYDKIIPSVDFSLIFPVLSLMVGLSLTSSITSITKTLVLGRIHGKLNLAVNSAIMMRMFSLPAPFFKNYSSGELASRIGYVASLCQVVSDTLLSTVLSAIFSLSYFFQMGQFAPNLVTPGLAIIFVSISFSILMTIVRQKINNKKLDLSPKLQSLVFSLFSGIQKIKITGAEKRAFAKWSKTYSKIEQLDYSPSFLIKISNVLEMIISSLGTIVLYYYASLSKISTSNYLAFIGAYGSISFAVMSISGVVLQIANFKPILELIKPFMNAKPENSSGGKLVTSLSGHVELNNISFRYTPDSVFILKNLSVKISKGEYVAIVGKTGCGKSTILRILLGFEKPELGAIYYGGRDLNSLDIGTLRQKIGVVMQNGTLFPGDIFSNIIVTAPWKTMDDAWEAARIAGLEEDINKMPMGMHTLISEGAGGISGGQKQRLMIARSIIAKPSILFLDEATSALDNITQKHISDSLAALECTRIVIAHRLSTVKNCDRILVLENGVIVEQGSYKNLMEKKGKFYELAIRQTVEIKNQEPNDEEV